MNVIEKQNVRPSLLKMLEKWPSTIVAREEVGNFTGGVVNPRTLANLDSQGSGPDGRLFMGSRKVYYDCEKLICWLDKRTSDKK